MAQNRFYPIFWTKNTPFLDFSTAPKSVQKGQKGVLHIVGVFCLFGPILSKSRVRPLRSLLLLVGKPEKHAFLTLTSDLFRQMCQKMTLFSKSLILVRPFFVKMALWTRIQRVAPEIGTKLKIPHFHGNGRFDENPWICSGERDWTRNDRFAVSRGLLR